MSDRAIIEVIGPLNERTVFDESKYKGRSELDIDFEETTHVTSHGIRELLHFINSTPVNLAIYFNNCHAPMVKTLNTISGLSKRVVVGTFYLPYECEKCQCYYEVKFHNGKDYQYGETAPTRPGSPPKCPQCQEEMEEMVVLETYFLFLTAD